jgi:hypothetical protein
MFPFGFMSPKKNQAKRVMQIPTNMELAKNIIPNTFGASSNFILVKQKLDILAIMIVKKTAIKEAIKASIKTLKIAHAKTIKRINGTTKHIIVIPCLTIKLFKSLITHPL